MTNSRTEDVNSGGDVGKWKEKPDRLSLVKKLKIEGYESPEIIAGVLKERYKIDVNPRTVYRDLEIIYEDYRYHLDELLKGGYIMEFHETLVELKAVKSRCKEANIRARELHGVREKEIKKLMLELGDSKPHTKSMYQSMLLQNDSNLDSTIQGNEKIIQSVTKDFLAIQGKTEVMKAFDNLVATKAPEPIEMPTLEIPTTDKKEDPNE